MSKWSKQDRKKASFVNTDDSGLPLGPFIMLQIQHAFLNVTPYICPVDESAVAKCKLTSNLVTMEGA